MNVTDLTGTPDARCKTLEDREKLVRQRLNRILGIRIDSDWESIIARVMDLDRHSRIHKSTAR